MEVFNLTGKGILEIKSPSFSINQDLSNLSNRLHEEFPPINGVITTETPKSSYSWFREKVNYYDFIDALTRGDYIILESTVEKMNVIVSLNELNGAEVPQGFLKKYLNEILSDPEILELSFKNAEWVERILSKMGVETKLDPYGVLRIPCSSDIRELFFNRHNILIDWDKEKKEIIIDFIYSEGKLDSTELAINLFKVLVEVEAVKGE